LKVILFFRGSVAFKRKVMLFGKGLGVAAHGCADDHIIRILKGVLRDLGHGVAHDDHDFLVARERAEADADASAMGVISFFLPSSKI